jgi:molybdopterin molybdotransferase
MLAAAVREAGGEVVAAPMTGDDVDEFRHALDTYAGLADLIITTGGVSAGAYEVVKDSLRGAGVEFVKVAMQPGMPQGAGRLEVNGVGTSIVTLPGNPVSALVSFEVFVRPPLRTAMALPWPHRPQRTAVLTDGLTSPRGKRQFRRGVLDHATASVTTYGPPASHHLRWLASANCLLEIGEDVAEMAAGSHVQIWDLSMGMSAVESAGWPDAPNSPEMTRSPKPPG